MPIFDYCCPCCGRTDERLVRPPVPDALPCPDCGADARRLVALPARAGAECGTAPGAT